MNIVRDNIDEAIKHLKGLSDKEYAKKLPAMVDDFYAYLEKYYPYDYINFSNTQIVSMSAFSGLTIPMVRECIQRYFEARRRSDPLNQAERFNEAYDFNKTFLQIFKNNDTSDYYNYIVLKANDLFNVRLVKGEKWQWKYAGQIDKNIYSINGELVKNPPMKLIVIFQKQLKTS